MRPSRRSAATCGAAVLVAAALAGPAGAAGTSTTNSRGSSGADRSAARPGATEDYLVLTRTAADAPVVAAKLRAQGVRVTTVNADIGVLTVRTAATDFRRRAAAVAGVQGVAADRVIGRAPSQDKYAVEKEGSRALEAGKQPSTRRAPSAARATSQGDPLDDNLWGMRMVKADQAHTVTLGNRRVKVGIMDTGVQADHPDIAPNFDARASRNFTTDIEAIDGPCEVATCIDPATVDDNGHGTHVAGTIAAASNDFGVSGVAPRATIVDVRAGQDSGYFFSGPTINALTYAGDAGLDVVNMSFYVDPWLYNCQGGAPEDTPEQAADQDTIIAGVNRALDYAHRKNVTLVAAAGNAHTDMADPGTDLSSPDYGEPTHPRTIDDDTCVNLPTENRHVIGVTSLGPSGKKADYSNYTTVPRSGEVEVSAPGGWFRDFFGTANYRANSNLILSTAPLKVLQEEGSVDEKGDVTEAGTALGVLKQCQTTPAPGTTACGYYQWLQGTSMASPHAAGVAALAVGAHGRSTGKAGFGMKPDAVATLLMRTATDHTCPAGGVQSYTREGRDATFTARCVGTTARNGFYGDGIVDAYDVVR